MKIMPFILLVLCLYLGFSAEAQNLNEPLNVTQIGRWIGGCNLRKVHVLDDFAYLIDQADVDSGWAGLRIIDVSNPENPFEVNKIDIDYANDIYVSGKYAYITSKDIYKPPWSGGLWIIDISKPDLPQIEHFISMVNGASGVHISGNFAYVVHDPFGLEIIDITDPQSPFFISAFETFMGPQFVFVLGKYAYITDWGDENWNYSTDNFVRILDINDPLNPFEISQISKEKLGYVRSIYSHNNYVFLADGGRNAKIFDISDPSNPTEIDIIHNYIFTPVWDVFFNRYLYVADRDYGLSIIEIKQDSAIQVGHFKMGNSVWCRSIYAIDNLIYAVSGYDNGLYILQNDLIKSDVDDMDNQGFLPTGIELMQNYPNPFNSKTKINFGLPKVSEVTIGIYNLNGQLVIELLKDIKHAGYHSIIWDANNNSAGVYIIKLQIDTFVLTKKCILIK